VEATHLDGLDLSEAEVEEDRLLDPLVHDPLVTYLFGDPQLPGVETGDRLLDGCRLEHVRLPELLDALRKPHQRLSSPIGPVTNRWRIS
jgi:hypothetical protein